ncbi:unnamed protein product, partial [Symbiodinium sp. CCMP2456]
REVAVPSKKATANPVRAEPVQAAPAPTTAQPKQALPTPTPTEAQPKQALPTPTPTKAQPKQATPTPTPTKTQPKQAAPTPTPTKAQPGKQPAAPASSLNVMGRPPASGQAGSTKVPVQMKEPPQTPGKPGIQSSSAPSQPGDMDVCMSPAVPKAASPVVKDVHMSGCTPTPAKAGTPYKPGYTPVKSPDYKKARKMLFEDEAEVPCATSTPDHEAVAMTPAAAGLPRPSMRRPDSCTTVPVGRSSSTLVLGDFGDGADAEEPATSVRRVVFEGYFGMRCQGGKDDDWPDLHEVPGASEMLVWMRQALPRDAAQGIVSFADCPPNLVLDMAGLPHRLGLVNQAWLQVAVYEQQQAKIEALTKAVNAQAEQTVHKMKKQLEDGNLSEDLLHKRATATELWRSKKMEEIQAHLDKSEIAALVAIDKAVGGLLQMWALYRDLAASTLENDMAEQLFMNELDEAMANFSLEEAW